MNGKRLRSRKLLLFFAFLLIDTNSNSTPYNLISAPSADSASGSYSSQTLWLMDETSGRCLGAYGLAECSELNLWNHKTTADPNEFFLETTHIDEHHGRSMCLGRQKSPFRSELKLQPCSRRPWSTTLWQYTPEQQRLSSGGMTTRLMGKACVGPKGYMVECGGHYMPLKQMLLASVPTSSASVPPSHLPVTSYLPDTGHVTCPHTGLLLPRNLDRSIDTSRSAQRRQVLSGSGVYTKTLLGLTFNIFSIAFYVDAAAIQTLNAFTPFRDTDLEVLRTSDDFYRVVSGPFPYERTILVKLAMTLKRDILIQGLVEEFSVSKQNAEILLEESIVYKDVECPQGLEIYFTWRHPSPGDTETEEYLEITIKDRVVIKIRHAGLAEDFFHQFFLAEEPVSVQAKRTFVDSFAQLLDSSYTYTPQLDPQELKKGVAELSGEEVSQARTWQDYIFSFGRRNYHFFLLSDQLVEPLSAYYSYTHTHHRYRTNNQDPSTSRWHVHFGNLLTTKRCQQQKEEMIAAVVVLLYCFLLIALSLPPALIQRTVREVKRIKQKSVSHFSSTLRRTLSQTSSFISLTRPTSTDLLPSIGWR